MSHTAATENPAVYGVMAQFDTPEQLLAAAERAYGNGFRKMDAYSPFPIEGLAEAIGFKRNGVAFFTLLGGICGVAGGYSLLYWITVVAYRHNVGGRPAHSWPAYIPISFECMILLAALTGVASMLLLNGLPQPYHPVFNVPEFLSASRDGFFLCIEAVDRSFDPQRTIDFLTEAGGREVTVVPL